MADLGEKKKKTYKIENQKAAKKPYPIVFITFIMSENICIYVESKLKYISH